MSDFNRPCASCGEGPRIDEEGCCHYCGADMVAMALAIKEAQAPLLAALKEIAAIKDSHTGGDWDEIEQAREIAKAAIAAAEQQEEGRDA